MSKTKNGQLGMKILQWVLGTMLTAVLVFLLLGEIVLPTDNYADYDDCTLYEGTWTGIMPDGTKQYVPVPGECDIKRGETIRIETKLPKDQEDIWFCVRSSQQDMKIYVGDELRQEYSTKGNRLFGKNSPSTYVFFEVFAEDAGKILAIESVSYSTYSGLLNEVYTGEMYGIWKHFWNHYSLVAMVSALLFLLSIITVLYSTLIKITSKREMKITYLGWGLLLASLWLFTNCRIRQFYMSNLSVAASVGFMVVMLLPYPFMAYVNQIQKRRYQKLYMGIGICAAVNFVVSTALQVFNIVEFLDSMIVSHIIIGLLLAVVAITMFLDYRLGKIREYRVVAIGFAGLIFASVWELYLTYHPTSPYGGLALCIGLVILLFTAGCKAGMDMLASEKEKQMAIVVSESKSRFLANMSHEIRTPINTILGMNEMILRENKDDEIKQYAYNVDNAGQMLLGLINDILDFSKIEAGKLDIIPNNYFVSRILMDVIQGIRSKAEEKGLHFKMDIDEKLPTVLRGDEIRICQILNNLLSNAVKYTQVGSVTFMIKGEYKDDFYLVASVTDTGMGIREKDMENLFDSFQRFEQKRNRTIEGTGLGLSITKQLTELMGGSIEVQSEYGKGSCFTVRIPQQIVDDTAMGNLKEAYRRDMELKEQLKERVYAPTAQILAVDDTAMNLSVVKALLKRTGVQLDVASGGNQCLKLCKAKQYDLILMDHMMPELDGIETLKMLRADESGRNRDTKVIVLTANAIAGVQEQYLLEGFADYLSKPLMADALENMLRKHLPKAKLQMPEDEEEDFSTDRITKGMESDMEELFMIDRAVGLSYCADCEEVYQEVLQEYCDQAPEYLEKLAQYVQEQNWADYRVIVHAIKGTSLTIGAENFSKKAKELEFAAADAEAEFLNAETEGFLENYKKFVEMIKETL